jgi:serine/threonine-protein kinase
MVLKGGIAKITDFGIARLPNSAVKTMTGLILGSPRYMSPEQVIGKTIDARSDIFSLGVVLYEALTGVAPFDGDNVNAIMYSTVNTTPPPPSSHNRHVPAMLDLIVAKAMAKLIEDRYQTIKEFAEDLREVRRQMDSSRPAAALKASTAPPAAASRPTPPEKLIDAASYALGESHAKGQLKDEEPARPLSLSKTFDSFDATLRLAAATDQTEDFRDYITATQKMRAYRGKIEPGSPLAPKDEAIEAPRVVFDNPTLGTQAMAATGASNLVAIGAIVILLVAAVGLLIALLVK